MKRVLLIAAALLTPALLAAQDSPVQVGGTLSTGGRAVDNDTDSSKFTEYRDVDDQAFLRRLTLSVFDPGSDLHFDFSGSNISLLDQRLSARGGELGTWTLGVDWTEVPHNYSNKAQTPFVRRAPGLFEVAGNVPITFKKLATAAPDTAGVLASDQLIAAYQAGALAPTPLATEGGMGRLFFQYGGAMDSLRLGVAYDRRLREGLRPVFGPIGDRPPRSLNVQLPEPVDHKTQDVELSAEWVGGKYQARLSYLFSDFANAIDTFTWENLYATPSAPGASFDTWDRSVSTFGRRALNPDNRLHNVSLSLGAELPADSRLNATFAYGRLEQNETLLPYSFNSDRLVTQALPRATAEAEMTTRQLMLDYVISPASRLNLRAFARYNGLDNDTPESRWQYVTSDTSNLNGTVTYVNKRINIPYAQDRTNAGVEATYRLSAWQSSLSLGYERDSVDRDHREADTDENRLSASFRARPLSWARLRARYTLGRRDGDYDPFVTREGYWYAPNEANDFNNPQFTFDNHPDMVRYDVADRQRQQGDLSLTITPAAARYSVTASVRYRNDDFDSDVRPVQPLASTGVGETGATTPGNQLGLLESRQLRYAIDAFYMPTSRVSFNAFVSLDDVSNFERSIEFNENNKANPSAINTAELGPWTRAASQWTADIDDRTWTAGLGGTFRLTDRVILDASYTASLGEVEVAYAGFGVTNFNGAPFPENHQFQFPAAPPRISQDLHLLAVRLEFPLVRSVSAMVGYGYERYRTDDWMQGTSFSWVEPVGSEYLLRDTSRSFQWGNRLFNLGSFLAPSYDAHIGWAAFTYRF